MKDLGYYFAKVEASIIELENNKIDLIFDVSLGKKAKLKICNYEIKFLKMKIKINHIKRK